MNRISACAAVGVLCLAACDTMNQPLTSRDFDPLRPPGSGNRGQANVTPQFRAGQLVRAAVDHTAFYKARPKANQDADKLLRAGTAMKVITTADSYLKVELEASGEVGYVPAVMVEAPTAAPSQPTYYPSEVPFLPATGDNEGQMLPLIPSGEQPPEGAIPTVIDPDAPANTTPVPPVNPPTNTFPAPEEPKPAPNGGGR